MNQVNNPYSSSTQKSKIFEVLSDLEWHCSECELPGSQPAKALQGIRQDGFDLEKVGSNWAKNMYCENCKRNTPHRRLTSLERVAEPIKRIAFSNKLRKRILDLYNNMDEILGYEPTGRAIEIDHRVPEIRWNDSEAELSETATDAELRNRYMLLVREHNLLKSRYCEKCKRTNQRQPFLGVNYFYSGTEKYEDTCVGCGWHNPSSWKERLNQDLANK
ncbi:MAG: hypothetical protein PHU86_02100 [Patescibacteria group bacterium]|nr:hypothetical protein [Patescibacteria group bacterium]